MRRWRDKPACQMGHRAEDPGVDGDAEPDANEIPLRGRGAEQHSSPLGGEGKTQRSEGAMERTSCSKAAGRGTHHTGGWTHTQSWQGLLQELGLPSVKGGR